MPGCVSNTFHGYKEDLPRPTMDTLLTQNPASLDHKNRFFEDTKKKLQETLVYDYAQEKPQYSDKKQLASKVTSREFIEMPKPEVKPPKGYREAVVRRSYGAASRTQQTKPKTETIIKQKKVATKQVSEVDDQG